MSRVALAILKIKLCLFINKSFDGFQNLWSSEFLHNMKVVGLEKLSNFHVEYFFICDLK